MDLALLIPIHHLPLFPEGKSQRHSRLVSWLQSLLDRRAEPPLHSCDRLPPPQDPVLSLWLVNQRRGGRGLAAPVRKTDSVNLFSISPTALKGSPNTITLPSKLLLHSFSKRGHASMDLEDRVNNCRLFCDGICPHAEKMERAYLVPQLQSQRSCGNTKPSVGPASILMSRQPDTEMEPLTHSSRERRGSMRRRYIASTIGLS